ncbi:reverse transcriptase domain-containing protein [Tanacetum coccineum]|uniref:Reverse transcriptase domain-containing protein n=1 Tax=Tanacetum coccineum TaxID=301880 RepID=A0ABQ5I2M2_9ASTR
MLKAGKLSHIIRELKQSSGKEQPKKKGEASGKEKPQAILMIQSRQKGFSGEIKWPLGQITLLVKIGDDEHSTSAWMDFMVVRSTSPHNGIIGRPGLRKIQAVPSTAHGMIKFPVMGGILTLKGSKIIPVECAMVSGPEEQPILVNKVKEERVKVAINPEHPEQTVMIGSDLTEKTRSKLCNLLQRSLDIFAWTPTDMTGVPRQIVEHRLNVRKEEHKEETLIVYLAALRGAVSAVTNDEREAKQMPLYFVSRALRGPEVNYTAIEKLVLALVHASKRLRRYFQAHRIIVITDQPIKNILSNPEVVGRMQKWSIQLGEFGIHYRPRVSVKGQVLADFIIERLEEEGQDNSTKEEEPLPARWTLFTDGSSCVDGCGAGVILTDPKGVEFTYALRFQFKATNNEEEYEALITGLRIAEKIGVQNLEHWPVLPSVLNKKSKKQEQKSGCTKQNGIHQLRTSQQTGVGGELKEKYVKSEECQVHKPVPRNPQERLNPITSPWPFYKWGIDIAGPFPEGPGKVKFLIVAMDYFTKWIEAKPVATITGNQVKKFVWENIVCRFGLPGEIISDNGKQFRDNPFRDWCEKLCIQQHFASVKHPQTNRLVERANRSLGEGIKARLGKDNKNWLEEISHVLWAHRSMIKSVGNTKSVGHFQVEGQKTPMLEKHLYDSWKSRMELYMLNRPHGRMILASVEKGPLVWPSITEDGVTRLKEYVELTPAEAIQADCDIKAINHSPRPSN